MPRWRWGWRTSSSARICTTPITWATIPTDSSNCANWRGVSAGARGLADGDREGRHRDAGARVCDDPAGGDPPELRRAAQRPRRRGRASHRRAAGAYRLVARAWRRPSAFHFAGVSIQPAGAGIAGASARLAAETRGAHPQYGGAGQGADRAGLAAGEGADGVQLQSRRDRAESEPGPARAPPGRSVHGGAGTISD